MNKTVIIYYSQTGQSRKIAEILNNKLNSELIEIDTIRVYDEDMWIADREAKEELKKGKLPELKGRLPDISLYDKIVIGGPVWGQTISNPILSFIRQTDFSGKTVTSFWTFYDHDENYNDDMKKEVNETTVIDGLSLPRSITNNSLKLEKVIDEWIGKWNF